MKRKIRICDICGADISGVDIRYKFKGYENSYVNYDDFGFQKWSKLDMCEECFQKFQAFTTGKLCKYKRIYCKDCKYHHDNLMCDKYSTIMMNSDFCSYAVKRDEE